MKAAKFHEEPLLDCEVRGFPLLKRGEKHLNLINQFVIIKSSELWHCFLRLSLPPSGGGAGWGVRVRAEMKKSWLALYELTEMLTLLCSSPSDRKDAAAQWEAPSPAPPRAGPPDPGPGPPAVTHPTWHKGNANIHPAFQETYYYFGKCHIVTLYFSNKTQSRLLVPNCNKSEIVFLYIHVRHVVHTVMMAF